MAWANRHCLLPVVHGTFYGADFGHEKGGQTDPARSGIRLYNFCSRPILSACGRGRNMGILANGGVFRGLAGWGKGSGKTSQAWGGNSSKAIRWIPGKRAKSRSAVKSLDTPCSRQTAAIWASKTTFPRASAARTASLKSPGYRGPGLRTRRVGLCNNPSSADQA